MSPRRDPLELGDRSPTPEAAQPRNGPVYVGGLDRSGKTTMAGFLGSHSRIAIPAVGSNMWTYFYRQYGDLAIERNLDACLDALWSYKHVRFLDPDMAEVRHRFNAGPPTYARLFALVLGQFADRTAKPRWGAQTGLIERYAPEMFEAYPDLTVIHMVRDPRDRYEASLALWPNGKGRAGGATARWLYSEGLARRHERQWPDQYLVVRFEDLVTDPVATVRTVCAFLGEQFEPEMMGMDASPRHRDRVAAASESGDLLSPSFIGLYRESIAPSEIAFIELHAWAAMKRRGYEPEGRSRLASGRASLPGWANQAPRMAAWRVIEELQQRAPMLARRRPGKRMLLGDAK